MSVRVSMLFIGQASIITQLFSSVLFLEVGLKVIIMTLKNFPEFKTLEFSSHYQEKVMQAL